jgi:cysteine-rich repeat protein
VLCLALVSAAACSHDWSANGDGEDDAAREAEGGGEIDATDGADTPDGESAAPDDGLDADDGDEDGLPDGQPAEDATADDGLLDVPPVCGDGVVQAGEECDDGNCVDGDGCDNDQTYSCHGNTECDDLDVCTTEACVPSETGRHCVVEFNTLTCDDGDPCTTGDHCDGGDCVPTASAMPWYRDNDGDGYGDPGVSTCRPDPTEPWVERNTDCCDLLPDVNPAQTGFFSTAYDCAGAVRWDYDCDGLVEPQWSGCVACSVTPDGSCAATPGWLVGPSGACEVPVCGVGGSFASVCTRGGGGCTPGVVTDTIQSCN